MKPAASNTSYAHDVHDSRELMCYCHISAKGESYPGMCNFRRNILKPYSLFRTTLIEQCRCVRMMYRRSSEILGSENTSGALNARDLRSSSQLKHHLAFFLAVSTSLCSKQFKVDFFFASFFSSSIRKFLHAFASSSWEIMYDNLKLNIHHT